jgi:hypothetical protein
MNHIIRSMAAAASLSLIGGVANLQAAVELQQNAQDTLHAGSFADNYYNGGYAGNTQTSGPVNGNIQYGPGPALGFTFSLNADVPSAGSTGKFENLPTDPDHNTQVLYFTYVSSGAITNAINFAAGFTAVSFNFALDINSSNFDQTADVWSGLNGTGTLLATIAMNSAAVTNLPMSRGDAYNTWVSVAANNFTGVAESVTFGSSNTTAPENMEIDAFTVPEPSSWALVITSVALLFVLRRRALRA